MLLHLLVQTQKQCVHERGNGEEADSFHISWAQGGSQWYSQHEQDHSWSLVSLCSQSGNFPYHTNQWCGSTLFETS